MVVRLATAVTTETAFGRTVRQKEGGGITGKYANVEDVDIKADGERNALPSSYPVDGDGHGDRYRDRGGDENDGWGGRL